MIKAVTFDLWDTVIHDDSDEPKRLQLGLPNKQDARRALFVEAIQSAYPFRLSIQDIHSGYPSRISIQAMHSGYALRLCIQAGLLQYLLQGRLPQ